MYLCVNMSVWRLLRRSPEPRGVSGHGHPGEAEDLEVSHLCHSADVGRVCGSGCSLWIVLR